MGIAPDPQPSMIPSYKVRLKVVTPGALCTTIEDLKVHARIPTNQEDAYLTTLLRTAQGMAESYTRRKFTTTVVEGYADDPMSLDPWWSGVVTAPASALFGTPRGIYLPSLPLASVESFNFIDLAQNVTAFAPTSYIVDANDQDRPGRVVLRYFATYPAAPREILALRVNYTVGYGAPAAVPPELVQGVLMLATFLYDNRGECADAGAGAIELSGAGAMLDQRRVVSL
jgi:hypothetical protein